VRQTQQRAVRKGNSALSNVSKATWKPSEGLAKSAREGISIAWWQHFIGLVGAVLLAASLIEGLPDSDTFRRIVRDGQSRGTSVMKGFAGDANVEPYIDDIYAYLQARNDGVLGRGRPGRLEP